MAQPTYSRKRKENTWRLRSFKTNITEQNFFVLHESCIQLDDSSILFDIQHNVISLFSHRIFEVVSVHLEPFNQNSEASSFCKNKILRSQIGKQTIDCHIVFNFEKYLEKFTGMYNMV